MVIRGIRNHWHYPMPKVKICQSGSEDSPINVEVTLDSTTPLEVKVVNENAIDVAIENDFQEGTQKWPTFTKRNNATFPAGANYVDIQPLSNGKPITINGEKFYLNSKKAGQQMTDWKERRQDFLPEIVITSDNTDSTTDSQAAWYLITISYPADHPITQAQLDAYKESN